MTDAFSQKAAKRQRAPKLKRDPASGLFEGVSALNDPAALEQTVRWVKALRELEPLIAAMANDPASPEVREVMKFTGTVLQTLGRTMLDALSVHSHHEFVADASKPVLKAPRRVSGAGGKP